MAAAAAAGRHGRRRRRSARQARRRRRERASGGGAGGPRRRLGRRAGRRAGRRGGGGDGIERLRHRSRLKLSRTSSLAATARRPRTARRRPWRGVAGVRGGGGGGSRSGGRRESARRASGRAVGDGGGRPAARGRSRRSAREPGDGDTTRCREPLRCADDERGHLQRRDELGVLVRRHRLKRAPRRAHRALALQRRRRLQHRLPTAATRLRHRQRGVALRLLQLVGASRRFSRSFVGLRRIGGGGGTSSFRQSAKQRSQAFGGCFAPASCGTGGGPRTVGAICATVRAVKRGARLLPARQLRVVGTPVTPVEDM